MKKVGIFGWSSSLSHAGRMVQIARHLSKSYDVVLCGLPRYLESSLLVNPGEFELIFHQENDIQSVLFDPFSEKKEWLSFLSFLFEDIKLIDENQFDIVISDHRKTSLLAAEALKITSISITQTILLGSYNKSKLDLSKIYSDSKIEKGNIDLERNSIIDKLIDLEKLDALKKLNINNRIYERDLFLGDITIALDDHRIIPLKKGIPTSIIQLPPILFNVQVNIETKKRKINPNSKTVLISKGGTGQSFKFEKIIRFLSRKKDVQLILLGFTNSQFADHENVINLRYGPLSELLKHADLFISNGGSISLYHALNQGIKTCILPSHLEQMLNGLLFEKYNPNFTYLHPKNDNENYNILGQMLENIDVNGRLKRENIRKLESQKQTLDFIKSIVEKCPKR